jgi:UDP-N-acetylglucosamine--N-acetylmuramyl-(pentapeptide) pyrophosphoryl-undecaprenol N-acetylglucosamine transferase
MSERSPMHIVFAGGGTAGYWFPGLTVAHHLRETARSRITFLGTGSDFEGRNATIAGFQYVAVLPDGLGAGLARAWRSLTDNLAAYRSARRFLKSRLPDVVVGLGGQASAPALRAASALGIPTVLLENNAVPCDATQKFSDRAALVCGGFESLRDHLATTTPIHIVGNPIRAAFARTCRLRQQTLVARARAIRKGQSLARQIVVLAGTNGDGAALNDQVPKALYKLRSELTGWKIVHQTGRRGRRATQALYRKLGLSAEVTAYIPDMPRVLLASDLAITRPGGITLFELAAAGVPAVVVPSEGPTEQHQAANAAAFAPATCRIVTEAGEGRLDDRLTETLGGIVSSPRLRLRMSAAMLERARPDAAARVAAMVLDHAGSRPLLDVA